MLVKMSIRIICEAIICFTNFLLFVKNKIFGNDDSKPKHKQVCVNYCYNNFNLLKIKILDSCPNKEFVRQFYQDKISSTDSPSATNKIKSYRGDCGIDLIFPEDRILDVNKVTKCGMGIACEFIPAHCCGSGAFDLVPRSSISNTPLMLANSIGIFDPEYRGEVIAAIRCCSDNESAPKFLHYTVTKGTRLVQIVAPDRKPIKLELVNELSKTERGSNGFGSTNTNSQQ
ncbi:MAG: deoxyuridine 5'-triphosphate nucleotidohydrolase [Satyrvirus sp.]|uniref:dUTP diphosphatase n=1 Tax=Satyrvirus sp. TaxID=2487771 RepID=A0A3G5AE24_9VIRU|nr:MAG: deoxyuridine 5'-triphosphate nucleotidohydrolase [Satyrvirus sp.]